jgi:hypothetical protein
LKARHRRINLAFGFSVKEVRIEREREALKYRNSRENERIEKTNRRTN